MTDSSESMWLNVPDFEGYVVNPYGEVYSRDREVTTSHGVTRRYRAKRLAVVSGNVLLSRGPDKRRVKTSDLVREVFGHDQLSRDRAEEFRPVPGYGGAYEVSDFGRVRAVHEFTVERGGQSVRVSGLQWIADGGVVLNDPTASGPDGSPGGWVRVDPTALRRAAFGVEDSEGSGDGPGGPWKPVVGFDGYEVNRDGDVRKASTGRVLTARGGYVTLVRGPSRYRRRGEDLARTAFNPVAVQAENVTWSPVDGFPGYEMADYLGRRRVRRVGTTWIDTDGVERRAPGREAEVNNGRVYLDRGGHYVKRPVMSLRAPTLTVITGGGGTTEPEG